MVIKKIVALISLCSILVLTACDGSSTTEKIYNHLEEAVSLEETFEEQQHSIVQLEKKEQELYSKIMDLGMDKFEKIKELSNEAIQSIEKRSEKVELEKESIESSKEEFMKIKDLIAKLENKKVQEKANKLYDVMMKRYNAYEKLNQAYTKSLTLEIELYQMLQKKDVKQEDLSEHIAKINDSYKKVLDANDAFNNYTKEYNNLKKEFYKIAELNVEYGENESESDKK